MLDKAELRMFEGAWRIARQKELIAEMSTRGADLGSGPIKVLARARIG
jgi:hypothetical protein